MVNRILVLGSAGSGKSTLSQILGTSFKLPVIHLDRYYWKPNWIPTPNEEWDQLLEQLCNEEQWIMDGNYSRTIDIRLSKADMVLFLDLPTLLCIYRVLKRRIKYRHKTRPDMNEGCSEKLDWEFIKWVWNYRRRSRQKILDKLSEVRNEKQIIILKNRKQVNELISQIMKGELKTAYAPSVVRCIIMEEGLDDT